MELIYNTSIFLMNLFIHLSAPFSSKARLWIDGRKSQKLPELRDERVIWMHCSSLGEFEQGRPVLEDLKFQLPEHIFVLSFFSPSGYERLKNNDDIADHILYLPIDLPGLASEFIDSINPELSIFVKYDFWLNYIKEINTRKAKLVYISVLLDNKNGIFRGFNRPLLNELKKTERIFTQNGETHQLLQEYGFKNTDIAGDTRIDRVLEIAASEYRDEKIERFIECDKKVLICGSTWEKDIDILSKARYFLSPGYRIIIAPHEISARQINKIKRSFNDFKVVLYSEAYVESEDNDILVIDRIGLLSRLYRYADIAYIGGGFGKGIHNTLEPGSYGIPVIFGKRFDGFAEAKWLVGKKAFFSVCNSEELKSVFLQLENTDRYQNAVEQIKLFFEKNRNATKKISDYILNNSQFSENA